MPKSKRAKVVHLSKVEKKGKEITLRLYAAVQECVNKYPYLYVFAVDNMRNTYLKDVRVQLSDSRLFFGKTKVMAKALGADLSTEPLPGLSRLSPHFHGAVGLLFSPRSPSMVHSYFENYRPLDYARAGTKAPRSFTLPAGIVYSRGGEIPKQEDVPLAHGIEPTLRKLGVPSRLVKGIVELDNEFEVCKEGDVLSSAQTTLLKMFGIAMAEFGVEVRAYWVAETGEVVVLEGVKGNGDDEIEDAESLEEMES